MSWYYAPKTSLFPYSIHVVLIFSIKLKIDLDKLCESTVDDYSNVDGDNGVPVFKPVEKHVCVTMTMTM